MRDPEISERIRIRIRESNRNYSPKEQKAELLLRNQQFLEERERKGLPLRHPATDTRWELTEYNAEWQNFNYRWWIDGYWDGCDATLWEHVMMEPGVFFRDPDSRIVWILSRDYEQPCASDQSSDTAALNIADEGAFIYIKINPWTLKENLRELEPMIRKLRKKVFRYSVREMHNFGRDLCWYDLHFQDEFGKLRYGEIRINWRRFHPSRSLPHRERLTAVEQRKIIAAERKKIIAAIGRIRTCIERLTPIPARFSPRP
jgi:hypothetical protein